MVGIRFSFTKYNLIRDPVFVGLDQFKRLFSLPNFWSAFYNTLRLSIVKLLLNTGIAVAISLLLHEMVSLKLKKLTQTIIYLPPFPKLGCRGVGIPNAFVADDGRADQPAAN